MRSSIGCRDARVDLCRIVQNCAELGTWDGPEICPIKPILPFESISCHLYGAWFRLRQAGRERLQPSGDQKANNKGIRGEPLIGFCAGLLLPEIHGWGLGKEPLRAARYSVSK